MAALGNTAAVRLLEHLTGKNAYPSPVATYIILYNVPPSSNGGGTPIDDALTQHIRWGSPTVDPAVIANSNTIIWTEAPSNWGEVGGYAIVDAQSGAANILFFGAFTNPVSVGIGDGFQIDPGDITLTLT